MLPLTSKEEPVIVPVTVRFVEVTSVLLNVVVLNVFDSTLPNEPVDCAEPLTFVEFKYLPINYEILSSLLVVFSGVMMISRVPTPSLKSIKLNSLYFRVVVIFVVLVLIFLITYFWQTTLIIAIAYLALAIFNLFFYFFRFFNPVAR